MSRLGEKKDALKLIGAFRPNRGSTLSVGHAEGVAGRQLQHLQDTRSKRLAHRQLRRRTSHQITRHGTARHGPAQAAQGSQNPQTIFL